MRVQKFLGCRGYLDKAKSLCKRPLEDASSEEIHPFSASGYFQ